MANKLETLGVGHAYAPGHDPQTTAPFMYALTEGAGSASPIVLFALVLVTMVLLGGLIVVLRDRPKRHKYRDSLAKRRESEAQELANSVPPGGHGALLQERMRTRQH